MAGAGGSLDALVDASRALSNEDLLELKRRMDALEDERAKEREKERQAEEQEFQRAQKIRLRAIARGTPETNGDAQSKSESPEQKAARLQAEEAERRRKQAERERLEAGDTGPKLSRAEQLEQQRLNQRKVKQGVRQAKTGAAKHKFDLEAHEARKSGAAYKTGSEWHAERNSKKKVEKQKVGKKK